MIMNSRKVFYDESLWEKFENKLKMWTYALMHELLQNQVCSVFLYKLLIIIETIQLGYYSLHPNLTFLFNTDWLLYFRQIIQYFQINSILNDGGSSVFLIILYLVFAVELVMMFIVIIITYKIALTKRKSSTFLTYILKIFSLYGLLMNTILTIPFYNVFIATIYCNPDAAFSQGFTCYQEIYFLHIAITILGLILYFIYLVMFGLLYIELKYYLYFILSTSPNSPIPFAAPQSKTNLLKQLLKIILPFYYTFDFNGTITMEFISILAIYYIILLIQRFRTPPQYNKGVYYFIIISEVILTWITIVGVIHAFLNFGPVQNLGNILYLIISFQIGLLYLVIGIPFVSLAYIQLISRRQWNLMKTNIKAFKKETDIEMYVNILIELIETRDKPESRIKLEGLVKLHLKGCTKGQDQCVCQQIAQDNLREEDSPAKQKRWYLWVRSIMADTLDKFQKCPRLHLLNAYIHHEKLKNKFKALFELMITEENKPNMQEEFSIYRYKNLIEEEMVENDVRSSETKGVDVNIIVVFQNKFVTFLTSIEKSVNLHLEFWRELLEENPDIQKLQSLGSKITNTVETTNDLFKKLTDMNQNHIKCLEIYGNFLKEIVNDDVEGQRILEKADYITKSTLMNKQLNNNDERQKYGENSNTCIITCSGNNKTVGIVTNSNNEITRILQYSKSDLIGQPVNRMMPKIYSDQHDVFMRNYLETSESKIIGLERLVLAQNKLGYLVPCTLMIKVLPNLDEGIQIVGFLKDIDTGGGGKQDENEQKDHYIIYNANTQVIMGVTYSCFQQFGIPASLVYGNTTNTNEFTLDAISPDLADPKNFDDLKTNGMMAYIDTTSIQQNYLLGHGDSEEELSFEEDNHLFQNETNPQQLQQNMSQMHSRQGDNLNGTAQYKEVSGMDNSAINNVSQQVYLEDMAHKQKKKKVIRYRRAKVKAKIQDDTEFGDQRIQILSFYEVDENEDMNQQRSGMETEKQEEKAIESRQTVKQSEEVQQAQGQDAEDVNKSDRSSNVSGASVNDEMRQLKDFKALISEKTEPKSIRFLKRTVWLLMLMLITLTAVILAFRIQQNADVDEGTNAIYKAYLRHDIMADVNYYCRWLQLLATGKYWPKQGQTVVQVEDQIKSNLSSIVDYLQAVQFDVIKARIKMEARQGKAALETYPIIFLLQNNENKTYQNIFNDALFQYITSASSIRNSTLVSFNSTDAVESSQKNFFYVMVNGLFVLKTASESIAERFYNFYVSEISAYQTTFIVIMVVALFVLVMSQAVLIPIVFQVHKTNNRVMSLFGIIPIAEIRELSLKCERYMVKFLEDKNEKKVTEQVADPKTGKQNEDKEKDGEGVDELDSKGNKIDKVQFNYIYFIKQFLEVNNEDDSAVQFNDINIMQGQQLNGNGHKNESQIISKQVRTQGPPQGQIMSGTKTDKNAKHFQSQQEKSMAVAKSQPNQNVHSNITPTPQDKDKSKILTNGKDAKDEAQKKGPMAITQGPIKNDPKAQQHKDEKKEGEEELENLRSQKLLNSKDNNKSIVICQFSFFALVFIAYFIMDIVLELQYLDNVDQFYQHLRLVSRRPSEIKYSVYFTIEEVVTRNKQFDANKTDQKLYYNNLVYQNEREIFTSLKKSYPAQFSSYEDVFQAFNYENLCDQRFTFLNFTMNTAECTTVDNGLLLKGLRTAIVSVILSTNDMLSQDESYYGGLFEAFKIENATLIADAAVTASSASEASAASVSSVDSAAASSAVAEVKVPTAVEILQAQMNELSENTVKYILNASDGFDKLQFLLKYILPSIEYLNISLVDGAGLFLEDQGQIEQIKFAIFIVFMFLVFLTFWTPYLNNLSRQIWRTKGMLNMIPMDIIQKYQNLRDAFIGGDILQAVK